MTKNSIPPPFGHTAPLLYTLWWQRPLKACSPKSTMLLTIASIFESIVQILICIQFFILFIIILMIVYILENIWRSVLMYYILRIEGRILEMGTIWGKKVQYKVSNQMRTEKCFVMRYLLSAIWRLYFILQRWENVKLVF